MSIVNGGTEPAPLGYERIVGTVLASVERPSAEWFYAMYHDGIAPEIRSLGELTPRTLCVPFALFESEPAEQGGPMALALVALDRTWAMLFAFDPSACFAITFLANAPTCDRVRTSIERKDGLPAFSGSSIPLAAEDGGQGR